MPPLRASFPRAARGSFRNSHMECGLSTAQGFSGPVVCGVGVGGGSASAVVDVCVATHMRGLVPHDRLCEMRSGAVLWRRASPWGCSQCSLGSLLASLRRCALLAEPLLVRLLHRRECPAVSGEFAGDGDYHDRAGLASALE